MRKQTKLVAVLSAAALLAIGASMTSFAATGWAEENGTWVYYDKDGGRVTDEWKKSGNNWFYLDEDGYMATDALIEDDDNYFYVGADGAMVANQWVAMENEDAGDEDEPDNYWYYFQANGKAYKAGSGNNAYFRTINGKKYTFNDDAQMQYGWIDESGERQTGDDDWQAGVYFCGDQNDGAQAIGWKQIHLLDEGWDAESEVNGDLFDEEQDRWFYFKSNGKRYTENDGDKTINGRKYRFDEYGRMHAEWFFDAAAATPQTATTDSGDKSTGYVDDRGNWVGVGTATEDGQGNADYSENFKYYGDPEDGARVTKGWFQVIPSKYLHEGKYNDGDSYWYYSDSNGYLVTSEFKTINGKKYGFDSYGRMISGLKILTVSDADRNKIVDVMDTGEYENEDDFDTFYASVAGGIGGTDARGYTYYFGDSNDGAMKTGKVTVALDGDDFSWYFEKSGSRKGRGRDGFTDDKCYLGGKLFKASSDEKYEFLIMFSDNTVIKTTASDLVQNVLGNRYSVITNSKGDVKEYEYYGAAAAAEYYSGKTFKQVVAEAYDADTLGLTVSQVYTMNTAGTVIKTKSKCKTGDDFIFEVKSNVINRIYTEE